MGLTNAHDYEPLWQAHLADKRRIAKQKALYGRHKALHGLGDTSVASVIADATAVIEGGIQYLPTLAAIFEDPALPQVIQRVNTILSFTPPSTSTSTTPAAPLGLSQFLPYMDAYIYVLQNPILPWVAGAALLLFVGGIGYKLGRR